MGIFDKLKTVLFEDEEEEIPTFTKDEVVKENQETKDNNINIEARFKNQPLKQEEVNIEPIGQAQPNIVEQPELQTKNKEEKSVFQTFDEEEFDRIAAINRNRLLERDRKAREAKEAEKKRLEIQQMHERVRESTLDMTRRTTPNITVKEDSAIGNIARNYGFNTSRSEVKEKKRFIPSPVISPVYGILDKNYRREDILPRASSNGTLPKMMDVDNVRKRALGVLEEKIESKDSLKNFYNEENVEKNISEMIDNNDQINIEEELTKTAEIRIKDLEEQMDEAVIDNSDAVKILDSNENIVVEKQEVSEDKINIELPNKKSAESTDTLESDLFNLIDSMYEDKEEGK